MEKLKMMLAAIDPRPLIAEMDVQDRTLVSVLVVAAVAVGVLVFDYAPQQVLDWLGL